ncbi:MAG: DEAD/DEAH box helicase [Vicinamibacterales bacterium]
MQILHARAGARGWPWRVERVERFGRARAPMFLHLTRSRDAATETLVAVRPFEPVAWIAEREALQPMPAESALAIVEAARRSQRRAFALHAAERLRGDIHAWQLAPALALAHGHARVLVADDAGMGKTVSAGLAIAECLAGGSDRRCLILAPGHLLRQWQAELHRRLAIESIIVNAAALGSLQREIPAGVPIWSLPGCLIASIDFFKQPHVLHSLEPSMWDLLVVDEAHLACGDSERHRAADLIARRSRRVLLLTATPSDGGGERLRALFSLGAARPPEALVHLRHSASGRQRVERRVWIRPDTAAADLHDALAEYTRWIANGPRHDTPAIALLSSLLVKRALSSPHALRISIDRRLSLLGREPQALQPSLFEPDDDPGVVGAGTGLPVERERRRLQTLAGLAARAAHADRRLRALRRLVQRAGEPVVIFTCFRDTALLLAERLSPHLRVRLVHGELPPAVVDAALQAFTAGSARVLVATDVAAQGLNLHQRCRWIVHYDLPWRPPGLRQRIGRVDRLGQTRRAHATFLLDRTALAAGMLARVTSLTARMYEEETSGGWRWDVLAAAEARRLRTLRAGDRRRDTAPAPAGPVTVIEQEYLDAAGVCVERTLLAVGADSAAALVWAEHNTRRRQSQLHRLLSARACRRILRERAVVAAASESARPALTQRGLFDRRADRARVHNADVLGRLTTEACDAVDRLSLARRIATIRTRVVATFAFGAQPSPCPTDQ